MGAYVGEIQNSFTFVLSGADPLYKFTLLFLLFHDPGRKPWVWSWKKTLDMKKHTYWNQSIAIIELMIYICH
jgi:hypothetical protein